MEQMKNLIEKLNQAAFAYYNLDNEIMTDYEYDKLYEQLTKLEEKSGIVMEDSPTNKVGFKTVDSLKKVAHEKEMLSLDKTKSIDKLKDFLGDKIGLLSWKLDGLTVVLTYGNGKLKKIVTRGNGQIGEDITHNFCVFRNLPREISFKDKLIIRGEAVISYADFAKINETDKCNYKNPRNLCSGTVRNLNSKSVAHRPVYFFAFELVEANYDFHNSKEQKLIWLKDLGFETVEYKVTDAEKLSDDVASFQNKIKDFGFGVDGLVLTLDDINYSKSLGSTSKFPRDSLAFKWTDEIAQTKLIDVQWNTSRTGLINPVAIFEQVELSGTNINKASLHNINFVENMKLGIGDEIEVYKANMIIPQIARNLTCSGNLKIPDKCPVCDHKAEIIKINEGKFLSCTNPNCRAKLIMSLTHFASRDAMNIEGFSDKIIKRFVSYGFIKSYADLYELENREQEIKFYQVLDSKDPNKNHKLYTKLMNSIQKSRSSYLHNFIYALGINKIGLSNAKSLCARFDNDIDKIMDASIEQLSNIYGFGEATANSVYDYFHDKESMELLNRVLPLLNFKTVASNDSAILNDLSFVITGKLNKFKSRNEIINLIESLGGKVSVNVSPKTTALINNDIESKSSKNIKAAKLNIPVISEDEFLSRYNIKL